MNKSELLDWLRQQDRDWQALLAEIGTARMDEPGVNGEWSMRDLIVHLVGWNHWVVARLRAAQRGEPEPLPPWDPTLKTDDEINALIYDAYRGRSTQEVLDETNQVFRQLLAVTASLPDDVRIETVEPAYYLVWVGDKRFQPGEFFDHFRDDHESNVRAWLARTRDSNGD